MIPEGWGQRALESLWLTQQLRPTFELVPPLMQVGICSQGEFSRLLMPNRLAENQLLNESMNKQKKGSESLN
jgi:hypothetical protein